MNLIYKNYSLVKDHYSIETIVSKDLEKNREGNFYHYLNLKVDNPDATQEIDYFTDLNNSVSVLTDYEFGVQQFFLEDSAKLNGDIRKRISEETENWDDNLYHALVYGGLFEKEYIEKRVPFKDSAYCGIGMSIAASAAFAAVIGISTYNAIPEGGELAGVITGSLGYFTGLAATDYLFVDKFKNMIQRYDDYSEEKLQFDADLELVLYYRIIFETLKEKPNLSLIKELNRKRNQIIQKRDSFSKDVHDKLIRKK